MAQKLMKAASNMAVAIPRLVTRTGTSSLVLARQAEPGLKRFWELARVELAPPRPSEWPIIRSGFQHMWRNTISGKVLQLTGRQARQNALVAIEVTCWFFVGEIIGRKSVIGYKPFTRAQAH